jgi:hypothetical protein
VSQRILTAIESSPSSAVVHPSESLYSWTKEGNRNMINIMTFSSSFRYPLLCCDNAVICLICLMIKKRRRRKKYKKTKYVCMLGRYGMSDVWKNKEEDKE